MNEDFIICVSLFVILALASIIFLYLWLGKKRNEAVLNDLKKVLDGINTVSCSVNNHERSTVTRDNTLRSLVSKNQQKLESVINQSSNTNIGRIGCLEDRIVNEISSSTAEITSSIQQSHSGLSKSFKTRLNDVHSELKDIQRSICEFKEDLLKKQAQSFNGMESKVVSLSNEEHRFIEQHMKTIHNENITLDNSIKDVAKVMRIHLDSLDPLKELFNNLDSLCTELASLDKDILKQEKSLNSMVDKHLQIVRYTQELQKTSKDIFDLMKLMLMDSVVKNTSPKK